MSSRTNLLVSFWFYCFHLDPRGRVLWVYTSSDIGAIPLRMMFGRLDELQFGFIVQLLDLLDRSPPNKKILLGGFGFTQARVNPGWM